MAAVNDERKELVGTDEIKRELLAWARASILTRAWKIILLSVLCGFVLSAVLLWLSASNETLARLQTFNGALTIPVGALTWAFAFTFVFLVPMKAMQILMSKVMLYQIQVSERVEEKIEKRFLERVEKLMDRFEKEDHPLVQRFDRAILDIKDEGVKIRGELTRMADAFTKPITPPPPRVPVGAAHGGKEGNGAGP